MHIRLFIWWNRIKQAQGHDCSDLAQSGQCFSAASTEKAIFHPNSFLSFLSKHIWQPILAPPLLLRPQKQPVTGCASRVGMGKCLLWKASLHFYELLGLGKWDPEERGLHSSVIDPLIIHLNMHMCKSQENNILISKWHPKLVICWTLKKPELAPSASPFSVLHLFLVI